MTTTAGASKYFPKAQEGFTTTTSGSVSSGAVTVGLNSTGNYSNGDTVVHIIDPGVSGKEQSYSGIIDTSGVQVTGVVWLSGTNVPHASGATVVDYVAAGHIDLISAGALISHNADGTPKTGVTYPSSTFNTPTITDFTNATHTHASTAQGGTLAASILSNPYKFRVFRTAALNSASSFVAVAHDTKSFDTGTNVDVVTNKGRFTAPVNGFYFFSAGAANTSAGATTMYSALYKNGSRVTLGNGNTATTTGQACVVSDFLQLTAGDYVEHYFVGGSGSVMSVGSDNLYFSGFLISAT